MAVSNPPTFGAASNPAPGSVRKEFEAFGSSTSFYAYRRGGGIIPDTSLYSAVGLGTSGSPLQLSQFAGLVAESKFYGDVIDTSSTYSVSSVRPHSNPIHVDASGNVTIAFGHGSPGTGGATIIQYISIVKYNAAGAIVQSKWFNTGRYVPAGLDIDAQGNVYLAITANIGTTGSGYSYIMKLDSNYDIVWQKSIYSGVASTTLALTGLKLDTIAECIYMTGFLTSGNSYGGLLFKLFRSDGSQVWCKFYNPTNDYGEIFRSLTVDNSGNIYVAGLYGARASALAARFDTNGNVAWMYDYYVTTAGGAGEGGGIVTDGSYVYFANQYYDGSSFFTGVVKVGGGNGAQLWGRKIVGAAPWASQYGIGVNDAADIYLTCGDGSIIKLNTSGTTLWQRTLRGANYDGLGGQTIFEVNNALNILGSYYTSGGTYGQTTNYMNVARLAADGSGTNGSTYTASSYTISSMATTRNNVSTSTSFYTPIYATSSFAASTSTSGFTLTTL